MNNLSGGYIMVDLASPNKVKQLEKAAALNKPLLVYYADGTTEWGKVTVTYETVDDVDVPTYHITTANGFVTIEADGNTSTRPLIIEGDGTPLTITGFTSSYCKWSLSGTHLMLVCAGSIETGVTIAGLTKFAVFNVPSWVMDKIVAVVGLVIEYKNIEAYATDYSSQTFRVVLRKQDALTFTFNSEFTFTKTRDFRVQFDLLIDSE